jgi:hypothetical protein
MRNITEKGKQRVRERKKLASFSIRLTFNELANLDSLVEQSGFKSRSEFVIKRALADGSPVQPPPPQLPPEVREHRVHLSNISNRTMQIARALNSALISKHIETQNLHHLVVTTATDLKSIEMSLGAIARILTRIGSAP